MFIFTATASKKKPHPRLNKSSLLNDDQIISKELLKTKIITLTSKVMLISCVEKLDKSCMHLHIFQIIWILRN